MFSNFLADHFSLYTVILSPLYYLFGSYTLLYVQIISVLFGAIGVYKVIQFRYNTYLLPEIAMMHYLAFFGIYSALSFDYHDNTVSAMLLPWFIYYFDKKNIKGCIVFAILIVIGKENMPIWLSCVCAGLFLLNYQDKMKRNLSVIIGIGSLIYVAIIIKIIMPSLDDNMAKNGYHAFKYSILGSNSHEVFSNIRHHPITILKSFYYNHLIMFPELKYIKKELYLSLLYSGGFMLLIRPQYLIMILPIIAQKVLSDDFGKWGINNHYSIEFTPIIVLCFYDGLSYLKNKKIKSLIAISVFLSTALLTYKKIEKRHSIYYDKINANFLIKEHYQCEFNKKEVKRVTELIPKDANVSALTMFCPRLSFRKNIYQFPDVHDAEYILLADAKNAFPLKTDELVIKISELRASDQWQTLSATKGIYLFRKIK